MSGKLPRSTANRLLSRLSSEDLLLLQPNLKRVDLPLRKQLERPNKPIDQIYFLESGFASVVADGDGGRGIEVGLIGREGMTGLPFLLGQKRSAERAIVQIPNGGVRAKADAIAVAIVIPADGPSLGIAPSGTCK